MFLVVGLGNPGARYQNTRHNLGWMAIEHIAARWGVTLSQCGDSYQGQRTFNGHSVTLALPLAWMNQTGFVVHRLLESYQAQSPELIVIYDDLDLPVGVLRIKVRGRAGGHNGLRSVIACLGSEEFSRIKVGIGRPPEPEDPSQYVLSPFFSDEWKNIEETLPRVAEALECLIVEGPLQAMNRYHVSSTLVPEEGRDDEEE